MRRGFWLYRLPRCSAWRRLSIPSDLAEIKAFWPQPPEHIKAAISANLKTDKDKERAATTARFTRHLQRGTGGR